MWVFDDVLWLAWVLVAHVMSSLVDILVDFTWSWLRVKVVGVQRIDVYGCISRKSFVLEVIFLNGVSVSDFSWPFSNVIFSILIKGVCLSEVHVSHILLDISRLVSS